MDALNRHREYKPFDLGLSVIDGQSTVKSEGGVDCARAQNDDGSGNMFEMGLAKVEDAHGWPVMNARANGALAM
jgi:hypothetical protein